MAALGAVVPMEVVRLATCVYHTEQCTCDHIRHRHAISTYHITVVFAVHLCRDINPIRPPTGRSTIWRGGHTRWQGSCTRTSLPAGASSSCRWRGGGLDVHVYTYIPAAGCT